MKITQLFKPRERLTLETYLEKFEIKDIEEYLSPTGKYLEDPFTYINMQEAVDMFKKHHNNASKTYILCDSSDSDGYCSTTLLVLYMWSLNPEWDIEILIHPDKTRGLQDPTLMNKIRDFPRPFLIIPDSGTNDRGQAFELKSDLNIDILVLDHHNLDTPIEDGVLINNQVGGVDPCGSGAIVTHIFTRALDLELGVRYSQNLIDLASLSIISDGMDVRSLQNRTYLYYGIMNRKSISNPFLIELFDKFIGDKDYTQRDISFSVVPKLNAVGRSAGYEFKDQMLDGLMGKCTPEELTEAVNMCGDKHKEQIASVNSFIEQNIDKINTNNQVLFFADSEVNRMHSGLLAGKIKDKLDNKPTIIGKIFNGVMIGSLRSDSPLQKILSESEYVEWASGHDCQCGVCIKEENIPPLMEYLNSIELPPTEAIKVVKSLSAKSIKKEYFEMFNGYEDLWNNNSLPKPLFHIHKISINSGDIQIIGKNKRTLKFKSNGVEYIIFNALKEDKTNLLLGYYDEKDKFIEDNQNKHLELEVLGYLNTNEWNGNITNQVIIEKYEVSYELKRSTIDDIF